MTITIDIHLHPEDGDIGVQLDKHMLALGYEKRTPTLREIAHAAHDAGVEIDFSLTRQDAPVGEGVLTAAATPLATAELAEASTNLAAPARKRGEPSPGKKRRTAAEIAEDEAANAADDAKFEGSRQDYIEAKGAISETPEDRQDPNNPEVVDDAETAAADAADEAAETAAAKTGLTLDDIRATLKLYVTAYGIPAAQEDGPKIISSVCGEGKIKVSDVPDDKIEAVIAAIKAAGKANTYKRTLLVQS